MHIRPLLEVGLLSVLAAGCAHRSAIARQPVGPAECGGYAGWALVLNGSVIWTTESQAEMREWLSRIDSTDVRTMVVRTGAEAAAIYGARGADGVVEVTLKRGSASEKRFRVPPPPRPNRMFCVRHMIARPAPTSPAEVPPATLPHHTVGAGRASSEGPR